MDSGPSLDGVSSAEALFAQIKGLGTDEAEKLMNLMIAKDF